MSILSKSLILGTLWKPMINFEYIFNNMVLNFTKKRNKKRRKSSSQCKSASSFFRLGGIVVIRHFTLASAELISNPESLVSIVNTANI